MSYSANFANPQKDSNEEKQFVSRISRYLRGGFVLLSIMVGLLFAGVGSWAYFSQYYVNKEYSIGEIEKIVSIQVGDTASVVAQALKNEGIIKSSFLFETYLSLSDSADKIQAGKYRFEETVSLSSLVDKFVSGDVFIDTVKFRALEGKTLSDLSEKIAEIGLEKEGISFEEYVNNLALLLPQNLSVAQSSPGAASVYVQALDLPDSLQVLQSEKTYNEVILQLLDRYPYLSEIPAGVGFEGYLFPDTYHLRLGATYDEIIFRMLENFDDKTKDIRNHFSNSSETSKFVGELQTPNLNVSLHELVTMASIIEKEVYIRSDQLAVSGVLWKRIEIGMPLQVDSSVNYVTGKSLPAVTLEDISVRSAYNTYQNVGLPPGPIANPGIRSLEAARSPSDNPYWFYLADRSGNTYFSETFAQHLDKKAIYLP